MSNYDHAAGISKEPRYKRPLDYMTQTQANTLRIALVDRWDKLDGIRQNLASAGLDTHEVHFHMTQVLNVYYQTFGANMEDHFPSRTPREVY